MMTSPTNSPSQPPRPDCSSRTPRTALRAAVVGLLLGMPSPFNGGEVRADDAGAELPDAHPVPRFQAIPLPRNAVSLQRDGIELTRLHFGRDLDRPFLHPVNLGRTDAPSVSLTRMGHPHDPVTHSHHNSVWISHHDVDGVDFWTDLEHAGTGRIQQYRVERLFDGEGGAGAVILNRWIEEQSQVILLEERRAVRALPTGEDPSALDWLLVVDLEFTTPEGRESTTLNTTPFGLVGVRMAKSIGVDDGGGRILNSDGLRNEAAVFRKPARWVDYSGPLTRDATAGITLLDHPDNPGHPAAFHVRNDGWMGACATLDRSIKVSGDSPLILRYGLWVHEGVASRVACQAIWERFVQLPAPPPSDAKP